MRRRPQRPFASSPRRKGASRGPETAHPDESAEWYEEYVEDEVSVAGPSNLAQSSSGASSKAPPTPFRPNKTIPRTPMRPPGGLVTDALDSPMSVRSPQKPLQRSGTPKKVTPAAAYQRAPLNDTLRILLRPIATGLNLLSTLLMTFLSPFLAHFINAFVLLLIGAALLYFLGPRLVHLVTGIPGYLLRGAWSLARGRLPFDLPFSSGNLAWQLSRNGTASAMADFGRGASGAICTVAPFLCSRLEDGEQRLFGGRGQSKGNKVDRAQVARALTKEVRDARSIFDSVNALGTGGQDGGLYHTRIWELATAIKVSSHLPDKEQLAVEVYELGDLSRDLSDEVSRLAAMNINAFSWVTYEFDRLTSALQKPDTPATKLDAMLHSLMVRLTHNLENLEAATARSITKADRAADQGRELLEEVTKETHRLSESLDKEPPWKRLQEKAVAFAVGKAEPTKLDILTRDLRLTTATVERLRQLSQGLAETRRMLVVHRDQVGQFSSGFMGFHLGASEGGLSAEEEVETLADIVKDMKAAVKDGKSDLYGDDARSGRPALDA